MVNVKPKTALQVALREEGMTCEKLAARVRQPVATIERLVAGLPVGITPKVALHICRVLNVRPGRLFEVDER